MGARPVLCNQRSRKSLVSFLRSASGSAATSTSWTCRGRSTSWTSLGTEPAAASTSWTSTTWTQRASTSWTRQASTSWTRDAATARSTSWTRRATVTVAGALAGLCAFGPGVATAATIDQSGPTRQYVVRAVPGALPTLHRDLGRVGTVVRQIDLINADVVSVTAAQATRLARDPRVVSVTPDSVVRLAGTKADAPTDLKQAVAAAATAPEPPTADSAVVAGVVDAESSAPITAASVAEVSADAAATSVKDAGNTAVMAAQMTAKDAKAAMKDAKAAAKDDQVKLKARDKAADRAAEQAAAEADKARKALEKAAKESARAAAKSPVATLADVAGDIGADDLQAAGTTGAGIDVALIDSGVSSIDGLGRSKVVHGPDLSFDSQNAAARYADGYGHGTHLAGIIAGRSAGLTGIAPDARIVSVKVADRNGSADVSQVIAGIDWVVRHAQTGGLNVRVLNLSFGTDSKQAYQLDPLAYAAEQAWHAGIVVVASVGNDGSTRGRVSDPAIDPFVIAVGAADTTLPVTKVASFSGRGDGVRNPDVLAPGAHVASLQPQGTVATVEGGTKARLADGLFLGSGTSQAAAVVSGSAALLLSARPGLTPDQVKALLTSTAVPLPSAKVRAQGNGLIDVAVAVSAAAPDARQSFARSTGTGSLDAARGSHPVRLGEAVLTGEIDIFGRPWQGPATDFSQWSSNDLTTTNWGAVAWGTTNWGAVAWGATNWGATNWGAHQLGRHQLGRHQLGIGEQLGRQQLGRQQLGRQQLGRQQLGRQQLGLSPHAHHPPDGSGSHPKVPRQTG